jgi:hypothetical protein
MNIIQIIGAFLQLFTLWYRTKIEKDAELKKKKEAILKEAQDGLSAKDPSAITASFDKLNRLR